MPGVTVVFSTGVIIALTIGVVKTEEDLGLLQDPRWSSPRSASGRWIN